MRRMRPQHGWIWVLAIWLAGAADARAQLSAQLADPATAGRQSIDTSQARSAPAESTPRGQNKIVIGLPTPSFDDSGEMQLRPNISLASPEALLAQEAEPAPKSANGFTLTSLFEPEALPPPTTMGEVIEDDGPIIGGPGAIPPGDSLVEPVAEPLFNRIGCDPCGRKMGIWGLARLDDSPGVGRERVMFAPFEIDYSQPLNNFRMRYESAWNWQLPDRAEIFWSRYKALSGKGPLFVERSVSYQDLRMMLEVPAGPNFSTMTELPIRALDPEVNQNTTGLGDMNIATKTVLINGRTCQLTQIFRTYINTGSAKKGLGSGHVSMEPGFLLRYRWDDLTYVHSEIKYWFPIAGDPRSAGQFLRYGIGVSRVLYDCDSFAVIPTLEWVGWTVLDGYETPYPAGPPRHIDPVVIGNLYPGVRIVKDSGGDFGLFELGISGGFATVSDQFYNSILRLELRWSY